MKSAPSEFAIIRRGCSWTTAQCRRAHTACRGSTGDAGALRPVVWASLVVFLVALPCHWGSQPPPTRQFSGLIAAVVGESAGAMGGPPCRSVARGRLTVIVAGPRRPTRLGGDFARSPSVRACCRCCSGSAGCTRRFGDLAGSGPRNARRDRNHDRPPTDSRAAGWLVHSSAWANVTELPGQPRHPRRRARTRPDRHRGSRCLAMDARASQQGSGAPGRHHRSPLHPYCYRSTSRGYGSTDR